MDDNREKVKQIISENFFMVLASIGGGKPWNSPVFYAVDENYIFYWYSRKTTQHSKNISQNSQVFVVIFNSSPKEATGEAVYIEGNAYELPANEVTHATHVYAEKAAITQEEKQQLQVIEDFLGDSELRMYKFIPEKMYINTADKWRGKWIDKRTEVEVI